MQGIVDLVSERIKTRFRRIPINNIIIMTNFVTCCYANPHYAVVGIFFLHMFIVNCYYDYTFCIHHLYTPHEILVCEATLKIWTKNRNLMQLQNSRCPRGNKSTNRTVPVVWQTIRKSTCVLPVLRKTRKCDRNRNRCQPQKVLLTAGSDCCAIVYFASTIDSHLAVFFLYRNALHRLSSVRTLIRRLKWYNPND